jgi:alanine racemase
LPAGRRDAWVEIDLDAVRSNLELIKAWVAPSDKELESGALAPQLMGVVKSDAYGHGAARIAEILVSGGVSWLAVASVDEGIELRSVQPSVPILILSPTPEQALATALQYRLDITVTNTKAIQKVAEVASNLELTARVHLKVDTGMHRLGSPPDDAAAMVEEIRGFRSLALISVFSHLAKAGEYAATFKQQEVFTNILQTIKYADVTSAAGENAHLATKRTNFLTHLASSEAARLFPSTRMDLVRIGINLYGLESRLISDELTPAMSVRGRINQIMEIPAGDAVGYGFTWTAERPTRLANLPIGYADGVDRKLSNRISAICLGQEIRQVGTISMDMMIFDITDLPQATEGDVVTLIGKDGQLQRFLADWALSLDTITYELACRLRLRLPRTFVESVKNIESAQGVF